MQLNLICSGYADRVWNPWYPKCKPLMVRKIGTDQLAEQYGREGIRSSNKKHVVSINKKTSLIAPICTSIQPFLIINAVIRKLKYVHPSSDCTSQLFSNYFPIILHRCYAIITEKPEHSTGCDLGQLLFKFFNIDRPYNSRNVWS